MDAVRHILMVVEIWAMIGAAVSIVFLCWGIDRIEPNARGSYVFRPMMVPGIVLLWPLVLWRWWALETGRDRPLARHRPPRRFHRSVWEVFAWAIPAILIAALLVRQNGPLERQPVQIAAPAEVTQ